MRFSICIADVYNSSGSTSVLFNFPVALKFAHNRYSDELQLEIHFAKIQMEPILS